MKHGFGRWTAIFLTICLLLSSAAFAFNSYWIDVEELKALTKSDPFPLTITKKTVTDHVNSAGGPTGDGNTDMLTLTVENHTGTVVNELVILVVCYGDDGYSRRLTSSGGLSYSISLGTDARELGGVLTFSDRSDADGSTFQLNIPCSHYNFTGAQAIVAQYTAGDETVTNPLAEEWQELALGSPTHILD